MCTTKRRVDSIASHRSVLVPMSAITDDGSPSATIREETVSADSFPGCPAVITVTGAANRPRN